MISGAVRDELIARYREPHRRYHTMAHIEDCLEQVRASTDLDAGQRDLLEAALWFHDAVYDPTRSDNEAESARLARDRLTREGAAPAFIEEVERLIQLTAGHAVEDGDRLGARLVSIDLSILGAEPERYDDYARAVREEYAYVPEPAWRAGRAAVMQRFLDAPRLFPDPEWANRCEAQARCNIRREIADLTV